MKDKRSKNLIIHQSKGGEIEFRGGYGQVLKKKDKKSIQPSLFEMPTENLDS